MDHCCHSFHAILYNFLSELSNCEVRISVHNIRREQVLNSQVINKHLLLIVQKQICDEGHKLVTRKIREVLVTVFYHEVVSYSNLFPIFLHKALYGHSCLVKQNVSHLNNLVLKYIPKVAINQFLV